MLDTAAEIEYLKEAIKRLGTQREDGKVACPYGKLLKDDQVSNTLEALNGTLKAAKKQKKVRVIIPSYDLPWLTDLGPIILSGKISFDAELLLSPRDDAVEVVLLDD
ncbi:hypothetical protein JB92DRAFT_1256987 [Gautieria morchelliformis]|nr:hypothetical protein JB92DRAFT_1256987 [Gautieria morchelliformis]